MPKAKKKSSSKNGSPRVNKSAWIRSQPSSLSAKEVVEKAEAEGIALSLAQVYTARSTAKKPGAGSGRRGEGRRGPGRPKSSTNSANSSDLRKQFVQLAVRVGTDEAQRLLDRIVDVQSKG
jgi:hypothetical protein